MVPNSWKRQKVIITLSSGARAGDAELRDFDETGVVLKWVNDSQERIVFYPWHTIDAMEILDHEVSE